MVLFLEELRSPTLIASETYMRAITPVFLTLPALFLALEVLIRAHGG
jgi:hypothetical protein